MNEVIESIYREKKFTLPSGRTVEPFPTSIKREEGEALYRVVREKKPERTLEVGMAWGMSSLFICEALRENGRGTHVAIDPFQGNFEHGGVWNVKRAGFGDLLTFYERPSQLMLAELAGKGERFEVIFIDGSHLFDGAFVDFYFSDLLLPVGGLVIFDDLWMPAVRKVIRFVLTNRRYEIAEEYLGARPAFLRSHLQNLKYQARKRLKGKGNLGAGSEMALHKGRNVNWCVLRKTGEDDRAWDHFAAF
ncbi:MAG TPA: class I SAM-dependent methyltransferase [Phycisphaerae bacterium]|nr:class I SAM-dependent methyltransferase [Phycisphaerae bacterium]